nr:MAG TPA: hypothetical protein [Caudoviricetes sp.]
MMGLKLMNLALGIGQGFGIYKQGKKIINAGEEVKSIYGKLRTKEKDLRESFENNKISIKKIKEYQDDQAKIQFEYNQKEIGRALEGNLRGVLSGYVSARENLEQEITNIKSKLAFNNIKNVESSSIQNDSINKLKLEANDKANTLIQNQTNEIDELENQTNNYYYQSGLNYNKTQEGINQNYLTAYSQAELQLKRDLAQLNQTIENGNMAGEQLVNQGWDARVAGINGITKTILDAGKDYYINRYKNKLGVEENIKEIPGTYNNYNNFEKIWKHKSFDFKGFGGIGGLNG